MLQTHGRHMIAALALCTLAALPARAADQPPVDASLIAAARKEGTVVWYPA